ncbi:hypothetical protein B9Z55_027866 [Caenorhabditis nigoni]|uniref:Uncharacterized protein n=2 Tax=Caenorhabditis nigoni TaxID=1611254 RepID=A0A2G5SEA8_9PELO|nr:hypothetical protein B9Z55_027866 [Caenorhabditis nigoni]
MMCFLAPTTRAFPPLALHGPASSNAPPPRPVNSFDEALEYWNNWNGRDERIDGIDLKEYLFHTDNGRYVPQIVRRVPIDVGQLFFVKNRGRDSYRSLTDQYRNEMNRTGLLRELQFINNSQEDQAAKGMIRIRDGKEESYSIPTKTHSENPSRTVMDNRPALQMNSEDVNDNQPLPDIQPEAQLFPHNESQPAAAPVKATSLEEGVQLLRTNGFRNIKTPNIDMNCLLFSPTKDMLQQCVTKVSNEIMLYNMSLRTLWRQPKLNLWNLEHWDKLPKEIQNEWCGKGMIFAKWQNIQ